MIASQWEADDDATAELTRVLHWELSAGASPEKAAESTEYLEWIGLLRSCTAFESYCKAYTADLQPVRIA